MALTTLCPHCQTAFRVANDQLKLRAGLVRCGACQKVFNGVQHLAPDDAASVNVPSIAPPAIPLPVQAILSPAAENSFEAELEADSAPSFVPAPSAPKARLLFENFEEDAWAPSAGNDVFLSDVEPGDIEPGDIEPGDAEPGDVEPGDVEPGEVEPGEVEPGEVEPGKVEPGEVEPGEAEPGDVEPGDVEPGDAEPGDAEPGDAEPGDAEPGDVEPGEVEPGDVEPGDVEPGDAEPGDVEPGDAEPGDVEPGDAEPGEVEPGDAEPGDAEPGDVEPGDAEPGDVAPGDVAPGDVAPGDVAPGDTAAGGAEPGEVAPGDTAPGDTAAGDVEPGDSEPGEAPFSVSSEGSQVETDAAVAQVHLSPASTSVAPIFVAPVEHEAQTSQAGDHPDEAEEPGFVTRARRAQRTGGLVRTAMAIGATILLLALMIQGAVIFRPQLAASFPRSAPILQDVCDMLGCRSGLPAQIDSVSIESSELQYSGAQKDTLAMAILLRNRSAVAQAWPNIELSLNDANDKTLVRRVFVPGEYLSAAKDAAVGIAATSEQSVRLLFDVGQLKLSGYRLYLFYP